MKNAKNKSSGLLIFAGLALIGVIGFGAGFYVRGFRNDGARVKTQPGGDNKVQKWTCSMHPEIIRNEPGLCPKCNMELIPLEEDTVDEGERTISFSKNALELMEIQTAKVERKFVETTISMVGKIDYDETRVKHITSWVDGRVDRLYVDFTGTRVSKGDHMVYLYSPELINAQAEFLQAHKGVENISGGASDLMQRTLRANYEAGREKLRLLGLSDEQLDAIEATGEVSDHITIHSPIGGIVVEKNISEGMYVRTGTKIYTVADLSSLWVKLDAYESDMMWIRFGQKVEFTTEAFPGEIFYGMITFISPTVDPVTRTVKLRVNVANSQRKLKPDMFVRAKVRSKVAAGGLVMDEALAGKWICPMHPSVISDEKGLCDICRMDLVTTESLGYVGINEKQEPPLVVPATAVLVTGRRGIVYVRVPDADKPTFEGREIIPGPRAGDYYLVKDGLREGETVVTNGNFKIDSSLQILAKPSMMSSNGGRASMDGHDHGDRADEGMTAAMAETGGQVNCPVMGGKIDKRYFVEYQGKRVYFCCPGCEEVFLKEPGKYLPKLPQFREN